MEKPIGKTFGVNLKRCVSLAVCVLSICLLFSGVVGTAFAARDPDTFSDDFMSYLQQRYSDEQIKEMFGTADAEEAYNGLYKAFLNERKTAHAAAAKNILEKDYITEFLDQITAKLSTSNVSGTVHSYSLQVFWVLVMIELFLAVFDFVKTGEYAVAGWASLVIRQILVISFFYWLVENASTFLSDIMQWFRNAGLSAGGASLSNFTIGKITQRATQLSTALISKAWSIDSVIKASGAVIASVIPGFLTLFAFGFMALTYVSVVIQAYFAIIFGMFVVGAGGARFSRDIAVNGIRTIAGIGLKLFTVLLVIGMALGFTEEWADAIKGLDSEFDSVLGMAAKISVMSLILAGLVRELPSFAAGFISGHASGGGSANVLSSTMMSAYGMARTGVTTTGRAAAGVASALFGSNVGHPIRSLQNAPGGLVGGLCDEYRDKLGNIISEFPMKDNNKDGLTG